MNGGANIPRSDRRRYEAVLRVSEGLSVCMEPEVLIEVLSERFREFVAIWEASCQPISKSQLTDDGQLPISITSTRVGSPLRAQTRFLIRSLPHEQKGTSLELAITRSIVESHGGRIWATSNSGPETRFHFTLPGG